MMRKFLTLIFVFTTLFSFSQNMEPLYFDAKWKTTTKENASFYRIQPSKKLGNLVLVEDFYSNKTPQFQGYSFQDNEDNYVGDVLWLDENGFDSSFYQFYNFSAVSNLVYYYPSGKKFKTVEYKNGRKHGETIIYHEDGTVLMKGKYEGGKPSVGDFDEVLKWDNYRLNKADNEADREEPIRMTEGMIIRDENGNTKKREVIKKKIFWLNSKQLAQEIWYDIAGSNTEPFKQINYDKSGKMLQTINEKDFEKYGREISNGIVYDYYFQNKFAVAVKSETNYKNGQKNGGETQYYANGKVLKAVKYKEGEIEGTETEYNADGTLKKNKTYKNGKPYDGNFDENFSGSLYVNLNYVKGIKEGEAVAKTFKNDTVVAKGIYKDDKPFNGSFIIETDKDLHELIQVKDFKKNGLQKVFSYSLANIDKTYNCLNDVQDGETIFYDDAGEITGKIEYKNGQPYEGKLVGAQNSTIYKKGAVTEEIYYRSEYDKKGENNVQKTIYFENGKRTKIVNQSFLITLERKDSYTGIYKNDEPFSGYFATDSNEFKHVDYYENGIIKYQYSNNYLENLEKYIYPNYDIKSTYKDGKIVDGPEYIKLDRQFISKYWKNGVLTSYDIDLFAMHYFNRFHFELKDKAIEITISNSKKKAEIVIDKEDGKNRSKLIVGKKTLLSKSSIDVNNALSPNAAGNILYYESNNEVFAKMITFEKQNNSDSEEEHSQEFRIITNLFISNINDNETIQSNFNTIAEEFSTKNSLETLLSREELTGILASLWFNKEKKPDTGILIVKNKSEMYDLKSFLEGKVLGEKKNIDFKNIRVEIENLTKILEKKMNENFK